ncbi:MAG: hypothetical protein ACD_12C00326G0003 [uncultured bacterium]|nr:MAG: hypothetical protein ACD_12C00326G0003 [uncultured bacterium]
MPMIPLVAMIAANFFIYIIDGEKRILTVLLIVTVVFPLLILLFLPLRNGNYGQIKKINYVLSQTSSKDYVYDGKNQFNVFRKDLDFFWFSLDSKGALTTYQTITTYHYNIYELIEKIKPKVISNNFIDLNEEGIANHYQQSDQYSDIYLIKGF